MLYAKFTPNQPNQLHDTIYDEDDIGTCFFILVKGELDILEN